MNISNKFLAVMVIASIVFSISFSLLIFNRLNDIPKTIAKVTEVGKINLSVQRSISILLNPAVVDFGSGFINTSCDAINLNGRTYANLTAGETYMDDTDCWTGTTTPTSFVVENNGNVNVSLAIRGPSAASFFNYAGLYEYNLTVIARNDEVNSCALGLYSWPTNNWVELSQNRTMCQHLKFYPDTEDAIAIDVNVLIPVDLGQGIYENSSIEFYAAEV